MTREQRYAEYVNQTGSEHETQLIKSALQRNQLSGLSRFVDEVERRVGTRIEHRAQGRPRKIVKESLITSKAGYTYVARYNPALLILEYYVVRCNYNSILTPAMIVRCAPGRIPLLRSTI